MTLTASEVVASLSTKLTYWEYAEYVSAFFVAVGCLGEYSAEFTKWWTRGGFWKYLGPTMERRKEALEKRSTLLLIGALALELMCLFRTNGISGQIIATLDNEAALANKRTAELQLKATELEEGLLQQGPRDLLLYGKRSNTLVDALRRFKGQKVQIRRCVFPDVEVLDTAKRLMALFEAAGWIVSPGSPDWGESNCLMPDPTVSGIWIGTPSTIPNKETLGRATQLLGFLGNIPLAATAHSVLPSAGSAKQSEQRYDDPDSIVVVVLAHAFERNKQTPPPTPSVLGIF